MWWPELGNTTHVNAGRCWNVESGDNGLFLYAGVGLVVGGEDNENSTSQVDCWQESWCVNTFCKDFVEVFKNRISPCVSGGSVGGLPIRLDVDSMNHQSVFNVLILWSRLDRHMWPQKKENRDLIESFMFCIFSSYFHNLLCAVRLILSCLCSKAQ